MLWLVDGEFVIEALDDFDPPNDVFVHRVEIFGGDPEFFVLVSAYDFSGVGFEEVTFDFETSDVAAAVVTDVPCGGDLLGVGLVHDRVEDGLIGEAWGPGGEV